MSTIVGPITPQVSVIKLDITIETYYTIGENNFGEQHCVTFTRHVLKEVLKKLQNGTDQFPKIQGRNRRVTAADIKHGMVWQDFPNPGFVRIWEVNGGGEESRRITLASDQLRELLVYFEEKLP